MGRIRVFEISAIVVLVLALSAGPVMSEPLKTNLYGLDGLFMATGGTVIPSGQLLVGTSMVIVSDDTADGSKLPVTVTYGMTSDLEFAAAFEAYSSYDDGDTNDDTGTGDLFLSAKYALQEETSDYPATALGINIKLPMADAPLSSEETDISLLAAMEMALKSVTGILNVEYLLPGGDDENQIKYVVGLEIPYSDTTDFSLELIHFPLLADALLLRGDMLAGGATFDMGSALNFGVAVGIGLSDDLSTDFAAMGKINFTF